MVSRQPNGVSRSPRSFCGKSGWRSYFQAPDRERPCPRAPEGLELPAKGLHRATLATLDQVSLQLYTCLSWGEGGRESWGRRLQRQQVGVLPGGVCSKRPSEEGVRVKPEVEGVVRWQGKQHVIRPLVLRVRELGWPQWSSAEGCEA